MSSIDPIELNKFNKTNQEWWDLDGEFKMLHQINPTRIHYIQSIISDHFALRKREAANEVKPLNGLKILDIGSGGGIVCKSIYELGADISGLDANEHNVKAASLYAKENNLSINYIHSSIEDFVSANTGKFDVALCLEVIEHVANPEQFMQNISRLVKDNGIIIVSTINRTAKSFAQAIVMAEYVLGWVKRGTHDHSKFIRPSELASMLQPTNFELFDLKGLKLSLSDNIWHLSDDIDVNYFASFKSA